MNKFLRIISVLVVGIGLILLFVHLGVQNGMDKTQALNQPSYYTIQNYWYLLAAGCGCVAFSIISCFLAWSKKMDEKVEVLPNAVAAEKTELLDWLSGSSLDTRKEGKSKQKAVPSRKPTGGTTEIREEATVLDATVVTGEKTVPGTPAEDMEATVLDGTSDWTEPETVLDEDATIPDNN